MTELSHLHEEELDRKKSEIFSNVPEEEARKIALTYYRYDTIASERADSLGDAGEEQVVRYREQGYLIIDHFLTDEEIGHALQELNDIIHDKIAGPKVQMFRSSHDFATPEEKEFAVRKVYHYVDYAPHLRDISRHEGLMAVIERLMGEKPVFIGEQALLKPPFGGGEKPWHQDMAYGGLFYKKQIVTAWVALDDAGLDNGCMHLIPRSHLAGGVPHYMIRDWQMCDSHVDCDKDVAAVMKPGSVLLFSGLLQHGTPANFSAKRRRALQFRYAPASSGLMSKEQFKIMFTNEMTEVEC